MSLYHFKYENNYSTWRNEEKKMILRLGMQSRPVFCKETERH